MRRVGILGSLLVGVMASTLAFVAHPAAAQDTAALSPDAGPAMPAPDDYYTRRAKQTLAAEKQTAAQPHPLAANYPDMDIVVCEAGCATGKGAQVVDARRRDEAALQSGGYMVTTAANAASVSDAVEAPSDVACIAGCYGDADNNPLPRALAPPQVKRMALPPRDKLSPVR